MIEESHPLQQLFQALVGRHYAEEIGIRDPQVVAYISRSWRNFAKLISCSRFATMPIAPSPTLAKCC